MNIRVVGPKKEAEAIMEMIRAAVPGCGEARSFFNEEGVSLYCDVREANQVVVGGVPSDAQVIELCRIWRTKYDVANYFGMDWGAASEILERMTGEGSLMRELDDSWGSRKSRYVYISTAKAERCRKCSRAYGNPTHCHIEEGWRPLHGDDCDDFKQKIREDDE